MRKCVARAASRLLSPLPSTSCLHAQYHTAPRRDSGASVEQFFADLSEGCPWVPFPSANKSNGKTSQPQKPQRQFNEDFTNGFKYYPNYLPKDEHDFFYKAALAYADSGASNMKHDGRQVLTGLQSGFYKRFFEKLKSDGILNKPEQFPPNVYRNGDGILPHFDNILHIKETVVSISLGVPDVVQFVHIPTGKVKEFLVEPRSLYIMSKDVRYNCTHGIEEGKRKFFDGKWIDRTLAPRVSLIAAEMFQPKVTDGPGGDGIPGVQGITMQQFKDFCIIGTRGVWQHLDQERGHTNLQQKVEIMKKLAKAHFPDLLPHFAERLDQLGAHAAKYSL